MSNETDLDWLARNVHVWPKIEFFQGLYRPEGWRWVEVIEFDSRVVALAKYEDGKYTAEITEQQWLARRAELQNKPSWGAVPSHANWLAQDAAGSWLWHSSEPECRNGGWIGSTTRGYAAKGCVLGDWRDTLEKRPEEFKPSIEEANRLAQEFNPFISIEGNQDQEMKQDNGWFERKAQEAEDLAFKVVYLLREDAGLFSTVEISDLNELTDAELTKRDAASCGGQKYLYSHWFERGELPPVGMDCTFEPGSGACYFNDYELKASGKIVKIIAHTRYQHSSCDVAVFRWDLDGCFGVSTGNAKAFRPIRTERDELVEIIASNLSGTTDRVADAIIASGFKLGGK